MNTIMSFRPYVLYFGALVGLRLPRFCKILTMHLKFGCLDVQAGRNNCDKSIEPIDWISLSLTISKKKFNLETRDARTRRIVLASYVRSLHIRKLPLNPAYRIHEFDQRLISLHKSPIRLPGCYDRGDCPF